jgi:hypothetical protein
MWGEPIYWVDTDRHLEATLDTQFTWSTNIDQVRKKSAQKLGVLAPALSRSDLSVRNGVLLYKHLIRPTIDDARRIWWTSARSHIKKLQVLQSKCLRIANNAPWYSGNSQVHEDLGVPLFTETSDVLEIRIKVSLCVSYAARLISTLGEC